MSSDPESVEYIDRDSDVIVVARGPHQNRRGIVVSRRGDIVDVAFPGGARYQAMAPVPFAPSQLRKVQREDQS